MSTNNTSSWGNLLGNLLQHVAQMASEAPDPEVLADLLTSTTGHRFSVQRGTSDSDDVAGDDVAGTDRNDSTSTQDDTSTDEYKANHSQLNSNHDAEPTVANTTDTTEEDTSAAVGATTKGTESSSSPSSTPVVSSSRPADTHRSNDQVLSTTSSSSSQKPKHQATLKSFYTKKSSNTRGTITCYLGHTWKLKNNGTCLQ